MIVAMAVIVDAPAILIILAIVVTVIVIIDAKHTIDSIVDYVRENILNPYFRRLRREGLPLNMIDMMKTDGTVFDKILAHDLEIAIYLLDT